MTLCKIFLFPKKINIKCFSLLDDNKQKAWKIKSNMHEKTFVLCRQKVGAYNFTRKSFLLYLKLNFHINVCQHRKCHAWQSINRQ